MERKEPLAEPAGGYEAISADERRLVADLERFAVRHADDPPAVAAAEELRRLILKRYAAAITVRGEAVESTMSTVKVKDADARIHEFRITRETTFAVNRKPARFDALTKTKGVQVEILSASTTGTRLALHVEILAVEPKRGQRADASDAIF